MKDNHLILGYDAREMWVDLSDAWNEERKNNFLFRKEVIKPFSVDTLVWPSVFDIYKDIRPSHVGFYQDLWENLEQLLRCLDDYNELISKKYSIISISLIRDTCSAKELQKWEIFLKGVQPQKTIIEEDLLPIAKPAIINDSWFFLGYDVADQWGTSALSNCGFVLEYEDIQEMREKWSQNLNDCHLFDELALAVEFKNLSNKRIKEHEPFFIYGLEQKRS